jgi:exopolysaccharide biosynthesis polyprenyl glycosylphosphotransferase
MEPARVRRTDARVKSMHATSAETNAALALAGEVVETLPFPGAAAPRLDRHVVLRRKLVFADVVAGGFSGLATGMVADLGGWNALLAIVVLGFAWPTCAFLCGLYTTGDLRSWASGVAEAPKLVLAVLVMSWPLYGGGVLLELDNAAGAALAASVVTAAVAALARASARAAAHRAPELRERTLLIGSGEVARRITQRLRNHSEVGLDVIGYVDHEAHPVGGLDMRWLGGLDSLPQLIATGGVDRVIIAFSRVGHEELLECIRVCRDNGIVVDIVPRLFDFLDGARVLDQIGGMPLMSIGAPRFSPLSAIAKRGLDVVGASLALLALAPLLIAIAIAIKLDSRGPILFVQRRPGRRGEFFPVYKFRSMQEDSGVLVSDYSRLIKLPDDERITRVGAVLRRFSLDEAPQLINVLRGDMSLVGPRPIVAAEADALTEAWQSRRSDLRPGLTGPWQIAGRSHIPFDERLMLDYQYVAGWSLARDLEILLATVPAVLSGRGAY